jgi:type IV pilus assembly protein PilC
MEFNEWVVKHVRSSSKVHRGIKIEDKLMFFQQLSTLVSSGTPMLQALNICAEQNESAKMQRALTDIASRVASGQSLHEAALSVKGIFAPHWIEVIRIGEVTGQMSTVLLELNKQILESRATARKIKGSLMYPVILIVVSIICISVMLWLVVPTFAKMFKDMDAELPAMTQYVVDASNFLVAYGIYLALGIGAVITGIRFYLKTEPGWRKVSGVMMACPMVGELMVQAAMYQFASNISLLLKSGVPMLETLTTMGGIFSSSPHYQDAVGRAQGRVAAGRALAPSLAETGLFTSMITNMVRIGEESGQLASVMDQIAPYYKERMEMLIGKVTKLLEPVIIMGMGISIAAIMLAIYMPMFEMAGKVK